MRVEDLLKRQENNKENALKYGENVLTYEEWNVKSSLIAEMIQRSVSLESQTVGIFLPNSIQYALAYFGILYSNKIIIPIDINLKEMEVRSILNYCEIDLVLTNSKYYDFIKIVLEKYIYKVKVINIDMWEEKIYNDCFNFISKSQYIKFENSENDVAMMLHTSGTTSEPKRVMLTHSNLIRNVESNILSLDLKSQDCTLICLPMIFGYCNTAQFLTHVYLGAFTVIMDDIFTPKRFFQIVEKDKVTNFTAVPSILLILLAYKYTEKYDYTSLRYICFGGGYMPIDKLKNLIKKFKKIEFVQTYGQTECAPRVTAWFSSNSYNFIGSVGKAIPNVEIGIVNKNDQYLDKNNVGEIVVSGKNIMKGYYKRDKETAYVKRNGWLHTGDLGYINDEGYLYLVGRIKNIIISGGINIYPEEVENIILQNENVIEAYVYGKSHDYLGEVPVAQVVLKKNINTNSLIEFCKERIADYKVPREIEVVDQLSRTYNGKIKRCKGERGNI